MLSRHVMVFSLHQRTDLCCSKVLVVIHYEDSLVVRRDAFHEYSPGPLQLSLFVTIAARLIHRQIDNVYCSNRVMQCVAEADDADRARRLKREILEDEKLTPAYVETACVKETGVAHICPSFRSVSMPRPSSCARPARSAVVVARNSVMICGIVLAQELTVPVQGTQPRLR